MLLGSDLEVISCDSLTGSAAMMELFFFFCFFISGSLIRAQGWHFDWVNLRWVYSHGRVNLKMISAASVGLMAREPLTWTAVIFIIGLMTTVTPRILALHIRHSLWTSLVNCCFMWLSPGKRRKRQPLIWTLLISKCIFSPMFRVSC